MKTIKQIKGEANYLYRLCLVNGSLDANRVRKVARWVLESKRLGYLALASEFERLVKLDLAKRNAVVESATPLQADLQASIRYGLEQIYGRSINITFAQNPKLIGGMRIKVGSDVYDGSIQGRLAALKKSF